MSVLAIELNDAGILASSSTLVSPAQPGCARYDDKSIQTGLAAQSVARLVPHEIDHTFWHQLSLDPLSRSTSLAHTHADLAHAQLAELFAPYKGQVERAVISVPASFSSKQLGLLLGICQRAEIPVTGLADSAVAAVNHPVPGRRMLHVDATNHCVLVTELQVGNGLHRGEVTRIDNVGLLDFTRRWASTLGDVFVKQTRFDPLHSAQAEQHLYQQVPQVVSAWHSGEQSIDLASEDGQHVVAANVADFEASVAGFYQPMVNAVHSQIDRSDATTVLLSNRVSQLPGFEALVHQKKDVRVVTLDEHAVTRALLKNPEYYESEAGQFALAKSKPWQETPSVVPDVQSKPEVTSRDLATHLLINDSIYLIDDEPFVIGTEPASNLSSYQVTGIVKGVSRQHCSVVRRSGQIMLEDQSTYGTLVNGKRAAASQSLKIGDRVSLGNPGIEVRLVREVSTDGQA